MIKTISEELRMIDVIIMLNEFNCGIPEINSLSGYDDITSLTAFTRIHVIIVSFMSECPFT